MPALQHGDKLRLRGRGIFSVDRGLKGDQYVEVRCMLKMLPLGTAGSPIASML